MAKTHGSIGRRHGFTVIKEAEASITELQRLTANHGVDDRGRFTIG